jgi:glycine betaine catabolism B
MVVTFVKSERVAQNTTSYFFQPESPYRFIAGQFLELTVPHSTMDDRGDKRWFTISSSPSDELISITTATFGDASSSFKRELMSLQAGAKATVSLPMGDFVLPKDESIPLIFVAGGIGITPFKSIVSELQYRQQKRDITLLHVAHTQHEFSFHDQMQSALEQRYIPITTHDYARGHHKLSAELVIDRTAPTDAHYIYVSGPEPLVETLSDELARHNIQRNHIFTDFFHGYVTD